MNIVIIFFLIFLRKPWIYTIFICFWIFIRMLIVNFLFITKIYLPFFCIVFRWKLILYYLDNSFSKSLFILFWWNQFKKNFVSLFVKKKDLKYHFYLIFHLFFYNNLFFSNKNLYIYILYLKRIFLLIKI